MGRDPSDDQGTLLFAAQGGAIWDKYIFTHATSSMSRDGNGHAASIDRAEKVIATLFRSPKRIVVSVVQLQDFHPSKATIEKDEIEEVVGEFRQFLESAVDANGKSQSTILEIK